LPGGGRFAPLPPVSYASGVARPEIWGEAKNLVGGKMFDFKRITLFCLEKRLSKHKMTIFSKNLRGLGPFGPAGYAYELRHCKPMYLKHH